MFWIGRAQALRLEELARRCSLPFEAGYVVNDVPRVTHAWEYVFGLTAPALRGRGTVLFLLPQPAAQALPTCGGTRTVLRAIERIFEAGGYNVKLCFCDAAMEVVVGDAARLGLAQLARFGELSDPAGLELVWEQGRFCCDVMVATGWQTFGAAARYRSCAHMQLFFCQDLEHLFPSIPAGLQALVEAFYAQPDMATITMSRYLAEELERRGYSKLRSLGFGVDTAVYRPPAGAARGRGVSASGSIRPRAGWC